MCAISAPARAQIPDSDESARQAPGELAVAAARELAKEGVVALNEKRFDEAADKLQRAYAVVEVPSIAAWLGEARENQGRWVEAAERYREAMRLPIPETSPELHEKAQQTAGARLASVRERMPTLTVLVRGAGPSDVRVTIDGEPVPLAVLAAVPIDPRSHELRAERISDGRVLEERVDVAEGDKRTVQLSFPDPIAIVPAPQTKVDEPSMPPAPPSSDERSSWASPVGWTLLGIGGVTTVVGVVTGVSLLDQASDLEDSCDADGTNCVPSATDGVSSFNDLRPVPTITLIVGGVLMAAGAGLLIADSVGGDEPGTGLLVNVAPGQAGLSFSGAF